MGWVVVCLATLCSFGSRETAAEEGTTGPSWDSLDWQRVRAQASITPTVPSATAMPMGGFGTYGYGAIGQVGQHVLVRAAPCVPAAEPNSWPLLGHWRVG
jgi:hypothetical protein